MKQIHSEVPFHRVRNPSLLPSQRQNHLHIRNWEGVRSVRKKEIKNHWHHFLLLPTVTCNEQPQTQHALCIWLINFRPVTHFTTLQHQYPLMNWSKMRWFWPKKKTSMFTTASTSWIMPLSLKTSISKLAMVISTTIFITGSWNAKRSHPINSVLYSFDCLPYLYITCHIFYGKFPFVRVFYLRLEIWNSFILVDLL